MLPYVSDVEEILSLYQQRIPMFRRMNTLAFRELVIESDILVSQADEGILSQLKLQADQVKDARFSELKDKKQQRIAKLEQKGKKVSKAEKEADPTSP